jgi:hypothetical protein
VGHELVEGDFRIKTDVRVGDRGFPGDVGLGVGEEIGEVVGIGRFRRFDFDGLAFFDGGSEGIDNFGLVVRGDFCSHTYGDSF